MAKSTKELAFLRDLYVDGEWTERFTALADKHFGFGDDRSVLYINAGTGNHALGVGARSGRGARVCAVCENSELLAIAREKAIATDSKVEFGDGFGDDEFDSVIADASLLDPADLGACVRKAAGFAEIGGTVALLAVASGSFGEVFSLLWEAMDAGGTDEMDEMSLAERLITGLPTVSAIETEFADAGLEDVESHQSSEIFEFENGNAFVGSPLVGDFLMPMWFKGVDPKEVRRIRERLARLIDEEDGDLTFRFTVKAVLISGRKS